MGFIYLDTHIDAISVHISRLRQILFSKIRLICEKKTSPIDKGCLNFLVFFCKCSGQWTWHQLLQIFLMNIRIAVFILFKGSFQFRSSSRPMMILDNLLDRLYIWKNETIPFKARSLIDVISNCLVQFFLYKINLQCLLDFHFKKML